MYPSISISISTVKIDYCVCACVCKLLIRKIIGHIEKHISVCVRLCIEINMIFCVISLTKSIQVKKYFDSFHQVSFCMWGKLSSYCFSELWPFVIISLTKGIQVNRRLFFPTFVNLIKFQFAATYCHYHSHPCFCGSSYDDDKVRLEILNNTWKISLVLLPKQQPRNNLTLPTVIIILSTCFNIATFPLLD